MSIQTAVPCEPSHCIHPIRPVGACVLTTRVRQWMDRVDTVGPRRRAVQPCAALSLLCSSLSTGGAPPLPPTPFSSFLYFRWSLSYVSSSAGRTVACRTSTHAAAAAVRWPSAVISKGSRRCIAVHRHCPSPCCTRLWYVAAITSMPTRDRKRGAEKGGHTDTAPHATSRQPTVGGIRRLTGHCQRIAISVPGIRPQPPHSIVGGSPPHGFGHERGK